MDAVSVKKIEWCERKLEMQLEIQLVGIAGTSEYYYFALPNGFKPDNISLMGGEYKVNITVHTLH